MKAPTAIVSSRSPKRIVQRVFVYNGNRRVKSTINGVTTPFIGNYFEWHTDANDKVRYYYAGGQRIAMRTGNNVPTSNLTYLFGDHPSTTLRKFLGSTSLTYKADTGATTTQLYSPWGEVRYQSGTLPTKYTFTGQYSYAGSGEFGLLFYVARFYDPVLGRFSSPDTLVPGAGNPMAWDRYAYTSNNPVKYIDPTGHSEECSVGETYCEAGELNTRRMVFEKHQEIVRMVRAGEIPSDLEGLAQLADYAAYLTPDCAECFVENMGATLTGHDNGNAFQEELQIQLGNRIHRDLGADFTDYYKAIKGENELMQSGYSEAFQDPGKGQNQAHHYWFYVQVGFEATLPIAVLGDALHETILTNDPAGKSYEDYALGWEGAITGQFLSLGLLKPSDVGDYIRQSLSPGSYSAYYWENPSTPYIP